MNLFVQKHPESTHPLSRGNLADNASNASWRRSCSDETYHGTNGRLHERREVRFHFVALNIDCHVQKSWDKNIEYHQYQRLMAQLQWISCRSFLSVVVDKVSSSSHQPVNYTLHLGSGTWSPVGLCQQQWKVECWIGLHSPVVYSLTIRALRCPKWCHPRNRTTHATIDITWKLQPFGASPPSTAFGSGRSRQHAGDRKIEVSWLVDMFAGASVLVAALACKAAYLRRIML